MGQIFQLGCRVTSDNYFTLLGPVQWIAEKKCSLIRSIPPNRKFQLEDSKKEKELYLTDVFWFESETLITLASYQCNSNKNVARLSSRVAYFQMFKFQAMKILKRNPTQYGNAVTPKWEVTYVFKWRDITLWKQKIEVGMCKCFLMFHLVFINRWVNCKFIVHTNISCRS